MIFPPVYSSTGGVATSNNRLRLEKSWSENCPERSEHARNETGILFLHRN